MNNRNFWKVLGWIVGICGLIGLLVTPIILKPEGFTIMVMVAFLVAVIAGILSVTYGFTGNIKFGKAAAIIAGILALALVIAYFAMALSGTSIPPKNNTSEQAQQQDVNNISDQKSENDDDSQASNAGDKDYALNEKPANESIVDSELYDKVNKKGAMVGTSGAIWYVQSGKPNSMTLHGYVKEGEVLEVDAYNLVKDGKAYSGGCILMINGPYDLDKNIISFEDGCAQIVESPWAQELLDDNIAVKFARGDMLKNGKGFSYKPWALEHIFLPDGLKWHSLSGKLNAKNDDYPR